MLQECLEKLCEELEIAMPKQDERKVFALRLGKDSISVRDLNPGVALHAQICALPKKKNEELFIYLMRANLLGQGTGGCRIGIDAEEKFLTLSSGLPYELSYRIFREALEDFANHVIYWKNEVAKFESEQTIY